MLEGPREFSRQYFQRVRCSFGLLVRREFVVLRSFTGVFGAPSEVLGFGLIGAPVEVLGFFVFGHRPGSGGRSSSSSRYINRFLIRIIVNIFRDFPEVCRTNP